MKPQTSANPDQITHSALSARPKVKPLVRDLNFNLQAEHISSWHVSGTGLSLFFNTYSIFAPIVERFIVNSLRTYEGIIDNPESKSQVAALIPASRTQKKLR